MLNKIIEKLNKTLRQTINNQSDEIKILRKQLREKQKELLEDFIMTINELQDIQAIKIKEEEKDKMRNSIINNKRTKYVTKLIELSNTRQSNR